VVRISILGRNFSRKLLQQVWSSHEDMLVDHMDSRNTWDQHLIVLHHFFLCRGTGSTVEDGNDGNGQYFRCLEFYKFSHAFELLNQFKMRFLNTRAIFGQFAFSQGFRRHRFWIYFMNYFWLIRLFTRFSQSPWLTQRTFCHRVGCGSS
jgi:hypothetical protein